MTSSEYRQLVSEVPAIPCVFASADGAATDISLNLMGSGLFNFDEGIPVNYAMKPTDGGSRILRRDINAIGNLGTRELYLRQRGGLHSFDAEVARLIHGYAYGAILDYIDPATGWVRKVRCIKPYGQCYTPIDDPMNGVNSQDPHWQFVDINPDIKKRKAFKLGDLESIDLKFSLEIDSTSASHEIRYYYSETVTAPCDCLCRFALFAKGHTSTDSGRSTDYDCIGYLNIEKGESSTILGELPITSIFCGIGEEEMSTSTAIGFFVKKGENFKLSFTCPGGIYLTSITGKFEYKECLK